MCPEVVLKFRDLISKLEKDVEAVVRLEREERELAASEAKVPDCTITLASYHLKTQHHLDSVS